MAGLDRKEITGKVLQFQKVFAASTDSTANFVCCWPYLARGKITDVMVNQSVTGANGTSVTADVLKNGTSVLSTTAITVVAATAKVDAAGDFAAGANTAPVLKTDSTVLVNKGDLITVSLTLQGTYSTTFPTVAVGIAVDSLDQPF